MQIKAELKYKHNDLFEIEAFPSQVKLKIDKAKEGYHAEGPNSVEMFLSSMAGCLGVFAKIYLDRHQIPFSKLEVSVGAELAKTPPMRLVSIKACVSTDADLGDRQAIFERFVKNCPVHNTLLHTKEMDISFG